MKRNDYRDTTGRSAAWELEGREMVTVDQSASRKDYILHTPTIRWSSDRERGVAFTREFAAAVYEAIALAEEWEAVTGKHLSILP